MGETRSLNSEPFISAAGEKEGHFENMPEAFVLLNDYANTGSNRPQINSNQRRNGEQPFWVVIQVANVCVASSDLKANEQEG